MLTKQDQKFLLDNLATKKDIQALDVKVDTMSKRVSSLEKAVQELTQFVVPAIGNILEWTDDLHRAMLGKPSRRTSGN